MWNRTRLTELLKIQYPIIQGPFGGRFSSVKLLSSVSNAGGLGSFGFNSYQPDEILEIGRQINASTNNPYNLNLWVPLKDDPVFNFDQEAFENWKQVFTSYFREASIPLPKMPELKNPIFDEQLEAIMELAPPVASFIFGIPSKEAISALKKSGTVVMAAATTLEEALLIEASEVDLILVTGQEAGGHRPSFLKSAEESLKATEDLTKLVLQSVTKPVIAAGGISNSQKAWNYLKMGASAVQIGTAFLACEESGATPFHKQILRSNRSYQTELSSAFTGRLARTISNQFASDLNEIQKTLFAPYPIQSNLLGSLMNSYRDQQKMEYIPLWAGIPSGILKEQSAKKLFGKLISEIESLDQAKIG